MKPEQVALFYIRLLMRSSLVRDRRYSHCYGVSSSSMRHDLEKLKIDVVDELHKVRSENAHASSEKIEKAAAKILAEIEKRRRK